MIAHTVASPPQVVRSQVVTAMPRTPRPGTSIPARDVATLRTFVGGRVGVALAGVDDGTFPAQTTDGGRTWRINGPALYTDSADAPLAISVLQAQTRRVRYAYGAGGNVVDVTSDGGGVWRRVTFHDGVPVAVVPALSGGGLVAYVQTDAAYRHVTTLQYVSRDGGVTWRLSTVLGGGSAK